MVLFHTTQRYHNHHEHRVDHHSTHQQRRSTGIHIHIALGINVRTSNQKCTRIQTDEKCSRHQHATRGSSVMTFHFPTFHFPTSCGLSRPSIVTKNRKHLGKMLQGFHSIFRDFAKIL